MTESFVSAGIACVIGAIVGGGLKAFGIEIPILQTVQRQLALGGFGVILIIIGLVVELGSQFPPTANPPDSGNSLAPDEPEGHLFNVAIAKFSRVDSAGKSSPWEESTRIFVRIKNRIESVEDLSKIVKVQQIDAVHGETATQRSEAAERLAGDYKAALVIYGTLRKEGSADLFIPEFYIPALRGAEELVGESQFGAPVACRTELECTFGAPDALEARTDALTRFTLGLIYLNLGKQAQAVKWFREAAEVEGWKETEGKEIIHLFLGTAYSLGEHRDLALAFGAYTQATRLDPEYARAYIGLGNVYYSELEESVCSDSPDMGKLDKAEVEYRKALDARNKPDTAYVDAKVHVGLGNIFLIRAQNGQWEKFNSAWREFRQVINDHGQDDNALEIVAQA